MTSATVRNVRIFQWDSLSVLSNVGIILQWCLLSSLLFLIPCKTHNNCVSLLKVPLLDDDTIPFGEEDEMQDPNAAAKKYTFVQKDALFLFCNYIYLFLDIHTLHSFIYSSEVQRLWSTCFAGGSAIPSLLVLFS